MFQVHFEDGLTTFQVGQLHLHTAVETSRTQQRFVQHLGSVGGSQNDHTLAAVETIHLCQQLVEGLFALIVAAISAAVAPFANRINLVDEDNAGCFLVGLSEEVAHFGGSHAHKHLHKFRAADGEERHVGLSCHGTGNKSLARAWRANQQCPLRQRGTDIGVFCRIM